MGVYGPEEFNLRDGKTVILRHCLPEEAVHFSEFQKQIASETTFTLQTAENTPTIEKVLENWELCLKDPLPLRLSVFSDQKIIAQLGFRPLTPLHPWTSHICQFGMMVLKEYWGQGVGRRMLEIMHVHARSNGFTRIEAMVRVKNERGVKFYKNAGYVIEGTRRQAALINGEYWDEFFISKLLNVSHES